MERFVSVFGKVKTAVIGMIHVRALPGTPKYGGRFRDVVDHACREAEIYKDAKLDGIMLENMHDVPWMPNKYFTPETTACMAVVAQAVRSIVPNIPLGIQILSTGNKEALAVAKAAGLNFIRAEGWVFAHIGDEGLTESCAAQLTRYRRYIDAEDILIFTDIKKKHCSHALTSDVSLVETAKAAELFSSDGVIVTGSSTGVPPDPAMLTDVKKSVSCPVLIGSGVTLENLESFLDADALILGSHFKTGGIWNNEIDANKVIEFMNKIRRLRDRS